MFLRFVLIIGGLAIILTVLDTLHRRKLRRRLEKEIKLKKRSQKVCNQNMKELEIK